MKIDLLSGRCFKPLLIAAIVLSPSVSLGQDYGGIASALIQGAINAQRMQQFQNHPRQQYEPRRRSRATNGSSSQDEKQQANTKKAEDARQQHEAFLKIAPAVKELIEDASTFVKENRTNPKLVAFIKKISELNSALAAENVPRLKPLMEALVADLRHEPGYEKLEAARSKQKQDEAARYLPELIKTAKQQQAFIRYYITNNPTAQATAAFIPLLDEFDTNLAIPDLEKLKSLTSKVDISIREAGLQGDFVKSKIVLNDQRQPKSPDQGQPKPLDQGLLRKSSKNAFLVNGDPRDFILLYNSSPQAPRVTKNLSGTIIFDNNEVTACLYNPDFDKPQIRLLKQKLSEYKLPNPSVDSNECLRNNLLTYDIIAVERGHFLRLQPEIEISLYSEVEANHFRHLQTVTAAQLDQIAAAQEKARRDIQEGIESGLGKGFGIIEVGPQTTTICMVVNDKEKVHRQLLQGNVDLSTSEIVSKPTMDGAYKALQRDECQAIYSSSHELNTLMAALKKDGTNYSISSVWNSDAEVQQADILVQANREEDEKERIAAQTQRKTEEELKRTMNAEENATAKKQQEALQSEFGKIAAAYSDAIAKDIRDTTDSRNDWQKSAAYAEFPKFVTWYQNMVRNHWELQSFNSKIEDYGRAEWKGRAMETGVTVITIRLRNRILGEYQNVCAIVGRMNDAEFNMPRDATEFGCDENAQLSSWKKARNFQSQWLVQPQS